MKDIRNIILDELKKLSLNDESGVLEHPKNLSNGDFSFFVKDKGIQLENLSVEKIQHEYIEKVEVLGRFVNFYLSKKYFADSLSEIIENKNFGRNNNLADQKIIIEFTDPNPFKPFHIGHLMSNSVGESISRITEWSGANVIRAIYQGDVGLHVAKAIWGMKKLDVGNSEINRELNTLKRIIGFLDFASWFGSKLYWESTISKKLGEAYVVGSKAYEDQMAKEEIEIINRQIYEKSDPEINTLYNWGKKVSFEHFEQIYKKLGTKFDPGYYFLESETAPVGMFIVEELLKKGILEKSDGAVVFKGEKYDLHTRVFVNSQGLPTYETKELGLSKMKFDRQDFDKSIVITASEQNDYFNVVLKVLEFADHRAANRTRHIAHGMLRFAEGKMSSRKGNVITGESLISDVEKLVQEKIKDRDLSAKEKEVLATEVAVGAIKYSILKQSPGKDIIFDFEKSLSFEGDSGPYLQYTHARINSISRKAKEMKIHESVDRSETPGELEQLLVRLPEIVERAQKELAPQLISTYLINLASAFNHYYAENQILSDDTKTSSYRLALALAVRNVLGVGLNLLGIKAPEVM